MYMSFSPSAKVFLFSVLLGSILGIFWDINRVFKNSISFKIKKLTFILDVIFSVIACVFTLVFFNIFTFGGFRGFIILGEFLGFLLYFCTITRYIYFLLNLSLGIVCRFLVKILRLINKIANIIAKNIRKIILLLILVFNKKIDKIKKAKNKKTTCFSTMDECIMKKLYRFMKKNDM